MLFHVFFSLFINQMTTRKQLNHLKLPNHVKQVRNQETKGFFQDFVRLLQLPLFCILLESCWTPQSCTGRFQLFVLFYCTCLSYHVVILFVLKVFVYKKNQTLNQVLVAWVIVLPLSTQVYKWAKCSVALRNQFPSG